MIDSAWFYQQLEAKGSSVRDLARFLDLDPSSVSRMLRGERKMSAEEQDGIAAYFGLPLADVAAHRRGEVVGFGEREQEPLVMDGLHSVERAGLKGSDGERSSGEGGQTARLPSSTETWDGASGMSYYERVRGCMKGTITVAPGVDLTEPADPEWARIYDE